MHTNANKKNSQLAKWLKAYIPNLVGKKGGRTGFSRKNKEMSLGKTNGFLEPQTRDEKVCNNVCLGR